MQVTRLMLLAVISLSGCATLSYEYIPTAKSAGLSESLALTRCEIEVERDAEQAYRFQLGARGFTRDGSDGFPGAYFMYFEPTQADINRCMKAKGFNVIKVVEAGKKEGSDNADSPEEAVK